MAKTWFTLIFAYALRFFSFTSPSFSPRPHLSFYAHECRSLWKFFLFFFFFWFVSFLQHWIVENLEMYYSYLKEGTFEILLCKYRRSKVSNLRNFKVHLCKRNLGIRKNRITLLYYISKLHYLRKKIEIRALGLSTPKSLILYDSWMDGSKFVHFNWTVLLQQYIFTCRRYIHIDL